MCAKHELTEKLKLIETQIYDNKVELMVINSRLESAYQYEDESIQRAQWARNRTEALRKEFFLKASEISKKYDSMNEVVRIFTHHLPAICTRKI